MEARLRQETQAFMNLLRLNDAGSGQAEADREHETQTTPLFTPMVQGFTESRTLQRIKFLQYSLLAGRLSDAENQDDLCKPVILNTDAPWSAFICGSQGSGKSYTLACMLENCLMTDSRLGLLPKPLSAMLFHYDNHSSGFPCEAAYLSSHIPVTILLSPSNFWKREKIYKSLPNKENIHVYPLLLEGSDLNVERIEKLMAFDKDKGSSQPLYMQTVKNVLRQISMNKNSGEGINYNAFAKRLSDEIFSKDQKAMLDQRQNLLESFMETGIKTYPSGKELIGRAYKHGKVLAGKPGSLTIVDLTDPMMDPSSACTFFEICMSVFLQGRKDHGRAIVLDEAHKFMADTPGSDLFTERLISVIREQRHIGAKIIIATQEPTISPTLLDLCSVTIVHRFTSPAWMNVLRHHLAGAAVHSFTTEAPDGKVDRLFDAIVNLTVGQSMLFAPSAMLDVTEDGMAQKLGTSIVKMVTRNRLTSDGGRSKMAASQD